MVAVVLSVNWRLSWWLWHVLMVLAFGYVAYSAYNDRRAHCGEERGVVEAP